MEKKRIGPAPFTELTKKCIIMQINADKQNEPNAAKTKEIRLCKVKMAQ